MSRSVCLLTEAEVAARLKCSVSKIRKLRYGGFVPYLPGRPVLILECDFLVLERQQQELAYARWAGRKVRRRATRPPDPPSITERKIGLSPEARAAISIMQRQSFAATKARRQREALGIEPDASHAKKAARRARRKPA